METMPVSLYFFFKIDVSDFKAYHSLGASHSALVVLLRLSAVIRRKVARTISVETFKHFCR